MKILPMLDTVKVSLWSGAVLQEQKFLKAKASHQKRPGYFTVRLTIRVGGVSPLGPDRRQI